MAYYKTQIKNVGTGYAIDISGKRLSFIGNYPCQAGDTVWTDGSVIFGNISNKSQNIIFDVQSGIPVLADNLRGYFDKNRFKDFPIDKKNLSDEILEGGNIWFVNNNRKIFWDWFPSSQTNPYEDVEVSDNSAFSINRDSFEDKPFFSIFSIAGNSDYELTKDFDDFKSGDENIELLFLKLKKGNDDKKPVKWFAAFRTIRGTTSQVKVPDVKRITLVQHTEIEQEISFTQPEIRNCWVEVVDEDVETYVGWSTTHTEIFTVDSDGNKKIFYTCDSSGPSSSISELTTDKVVVDSEGTTVLPTYPGFFNVTNFEGTATTYWVGIGIAEVTCEGTWYKVVQEPADFSSISGSSSEQFSTFTYPVQDDFYISADRFDSTLKLYDSDNKLVLDFATSNDDFLAGLKGFHNFAATVTKKAKKLSDREYILVFHDLPYKYNRKPDYLWLIKNGKVTKLSDNCYNYRFNKIKDIKRTRK